MTRRIFDGVLHSYLQTLTSRYTSFNGYWIWGMIVRDLDMEEIDLLQKQNPVHAGPFSHFTMLARKKFVEQVLKNGLELHLVDVATLVLQKTDRSTVRLVNGKEREVYEVIATLSVVTDNGRKYSSEKVVNVAELDPEVDTKSASAT